jgi:hypothetical protein
MSEPTGDGKQQPDSEKGTDPGEDRGEIDDQTQDATPDPVFSDPTAPVWADPTAPTPPAGPPASNPYAQQPPVQPYGQPQPGQQYPAYGQPMAGQPQAGQQYPAYGQQPYSTGAQTESNGSAIALTIVSGVSVLFCNILAIASLVIGIVALTKNRTEPESSRRLAKTGWIVLGVVWALGILLFVGWLALFAASFSSTNFNSGS